MMRFRLLGPLEVLATLLIHPGQIVSADTLINEVWGDAPPARAANLISIYVLRLRRLMADEDSRLLVTRAPGYQLVLTPSDTDALVFEAMVRDGRRAFAAGDPAGAARQLTEALALWHGPPLADVPPTPLVEAEAERLSELHLGAIELRITAELAGGDHGQAVAEIGRLLADHPLREGTPRRSRSTGAPGTPSPSSWGSTPGPSCASSTPSCWPRTARPRRASSRPVPSRRSPGAPNPGRPAQPQIRSGPRAAQAAVRGPPGRLRSSCQPTSPTSPAATSRSNACATCWRARARARAAIPVRSASPWWPARAASARPPWRCTRPTGSAVSSVTASSTSTCSARPRTRSRPGTCWPGSCVTSAWTAGTSPSMRPSAPPGTGPRWPGGGCWSCSTTRATPPRSGRCCRAPRRPRCW